MFRCFTVVKRSFSQAVHQRPSSLSQTGSVHPSVSDDIHSHLFFISKYATVGILCCGRKNGGEDCWNWRFPKKPLVAPIAGGGAGESRSWRRSIDTRRIWKNPNIHMKILTTQSCTEPTTTSSSLQKAGARIATILLTSLHTKRSILWVNFKGRINYLTKHWGLVGRTTKPPRGVIHSIREPGLACVNWDYTLWLKYSAEFPLSPAFMSGMKMRCVEPRRAVVTRW